MPYSKERGIKSVVLQDFPADAVAVLDLFSGSVLGSPPLPPNFQYCS